MRSVFRQTQNLTHHGCSIPIPTFLCPVLLRTPVGHPRFPLPFRPNASSSCTIPSSTQRKHFASIASCQQNTAPTPGHGVEVPSPVTNLAQALPSACPGCGAPTQVVDKKEAGYYNIDRRTVKGYLEYDPKGVEEAEAENNIYTHALKQVDPALLENLGLDLEALDPCFLLRSRCRRRRSKAARIYPSHKRS